MAVTFARFLASAQEAQALMEELKDFRARAKSFTAHHYANSFSTAGDVTKPGYINENADGNIDTLTFARQDYVSVVVLLEQFEKFLDNQVVSTGDYKVSVEKVVAI